MISASIVLYKTTLEVLQPAVDSILASSSVDKLYLIDNWKDGENPLPGVSRVEYIKSGRNLGYGAAHNIAMLDPAKRRKYHLVMNPDVSFASGTLESILAFMEASPDIGLAMPKVLNPDGSQQRLCKLLPSPFDLFKRRFLPGAIFKSKDKLFELQSYEMSKPVDIPFLSGCFMFIRSAELDRIGGFDESIFMYGEDLDLSRRFSINSRAVFFPGATVVHEHKKASFKSLQMLFIHCHGVSCYFNKWGWLFDHERKRINQRTLQMLDSQKSGQEA